MSRVEKLTLSHLTPRAALEAVDAQVGRTEKVHGEIHQLEKTETGLLVYEQYFSRVKNRVALVVSAENFSGETRVSVISTGSSQGLFIPIDWGAASSYVNEVIGILQRANAAAGGA
jgi:hypothetical protein